MFRLFKQLIQDSLRPFGYRLRLQSLSQFHPRDIRDGCNDPRYLLYQGNPQPVLIDAPLEKGYALDAFPLDPQGPHPFIRAISCAQYAEKPLEAIEDVLRVYYSVVQPKDALDWLGLAPNTTSEFSGEPAWMRIFPWRGLLLESRRRAIERRARIESREHGKEMDIGTGWRAFGPMTERGIQIEAKRLHNLMCSIEEHGLLRHNGPDGDVRAVALVDEDGDWIWQADWGGQHRVAALSAMGYTKIPVRIWRVIWREHVDLWPQVISGLYSPELALQVFDRIFALQTPPILQSWEREIAAWDER